MSKIALSCDKIVISSSKIISNLSKHKYKQFRSTLGNSVNKFPQLIFKARLYPFADVYITCIWPSVFLNPYTTEDL